MSHASKVFVGFSGVMCVVLASAYPAYNVLKFAPGEAERNLARFAHDQFSTALLSFLFSVLAGSVCFSAPIVGITALRADERDTLANKVAVYTDWKMYAAVWTSFVIALVTAIVGFQIAGSFFDQSGR